MTSVPIIHIGVVVDKNNQPLVRQRGCDIHPDLIIDLKLENLHSLTSVHNVTTVLVKNVTAENITTMIQNWNTLFGAKDFKPINLYFDAMFDDTGVTSAMCAAMILLSERCKISTNLTNVISVVSAGHNLYCKLK